MIKFVVVDDEEKARKSISFLLKDFSDVEIVGEAPSASEAVTVIEKIRPDLVFLDVVMPQQSGFDLLDKLIQLGVKDFDVIFLTAYEEFAIQAIRYAAFDYLLKPIDKQELTEALIRFRNKKKIDLESRAETLKKHISGSRSIRLAMYMGNVLFVNPDEIVWFEADKAYTTVFLTDGNKHIITRNLGEVEDDFSGMGFVRVHRSFIINKKHLLRFMKKDRVVILKQGDEEIRIPVATRFDISRL